MYFRLCYELLQTAQVVNLEVPKCTSLPGEPTIEITLRQPHENENVASGSAVIEAIANFTLCDKDSATLTDIGKRVVLPDSDDMSIRIKNDDGDIVAYPTFDKMSASLQDFIRNDIFTNLANRVEKFAKTLRWRCNYPGANKMPISDSLRFSVDRKTWSLVPGVPPRITNSGILIEETLRDDVLLDVVALANEDEGEPLYHELYREAWEQRRTKPVLAIVAGISAIEVAIKQFISKKVPEAEWFVENAGAPTINSLLTSYLPNLVPDELHLGGKEHFPKNVRSAIHRGAEVRNKIIHTGKIPLKVEFKKYNINLVEQTEELLLCVEDIFWLLDYYGGKLWALDYVRSETLETMDVHGKGKPATPTITKAGMQKIYFIVQLSDSYDLRDV